MLRRTSLSVNSVGVIAVKSKRERGREFDPQENVDVIESLEMEVCSTCMWRGRKYPSDVPVICINVQDSVCRLVFM